MSKQRMLWVWAVAAAAVACEAPAEESAPPAAEMAAETDVAAVRAAVEQLATQWETAANAKDAAALAALYAEDARFMPPNADVVQGRANIQQAVEGMMAAGFTSIDLTTQHVDADGDLAYEVGHYSMTLQPEGAPAPVTDEGKYIVVLKRQADGSWKLVADIFNTNMPAPTAH